MLDLLDRVAWWARQHAWLLGGVIVALLVAAGVLALVRGGGGGTTAKVPAGSVVSVDGTPITRATLAHWTAVYQRSSATGTKLTAPQASQAALRLLIGTAWVEQEAARKDVKVSAPQVTTAVNQLYAKSTGMTKAQVLAQLGGTEADLRWEMRASLTTEALQSKAMKAAKAPTAAQIQAAYTAEPERWAHPTTRDISVVETTTKAKAAAAAAALKSGGSYADVNTTYSSSSQLTQAKGVLTKLTPGSNDPAFERAIFSAPVNTQTGPVQVSGGWIVFTVKRSTPLAAKTLSAATAGITKDLTSTAQNAAVDAYLKTMRAYWHPRTQCIASVRVADYCA